MGAHSLRPDRVDRAPAPPSRADASTPRAPRWRSTLVTAAMTTAALAIVLAAVLAFVFHPRFDTVLSGSMRPGIQPGDVVMVRPVPVDELHVGDVIVYLPPQHTVPVLHRIIDIDANGLVTQGDANRVADPWGRVTPQGDTVGRLVLTIPRLGLLLAHRSAILAGGGLLLALAVGLTVFGRRRAAAGRPPSDLPAPDSTSEDQSAPEHPDAPPGPPASADDRATTTTSLTVTPPTGTPPAGTQPTEGCPS